MVMPAALSRSSRPLRAVAAVAWNALPPRFARLRPAVVVGRDQGPHDALGQPVRQLAVDVDGVLGGGGVVGQVGGPRPPVGRLRPAVLLGVVGVVLDRVIRVETDRESERGDADVGVGVGGRDVILGQGAPLSFDGSALPVVPRIDVVLDQVVPLPVGPERAAALLVHERVVDDVRADMADPAEGERLELSELRLVAASIELPLRLLEQCAGHLVRLAVVQHVAPDERLLVPADAHFQREPGEYVGECRQLLDGHLLQPGYQFGDGDAGLRDDAAGQVVDSGVNGVHHRPDGGVPGLNEVIPDLLQLAAGT